MPVMNFPAERCSAPKTANGMAKAQVGQGYHFVDATSLADIVFRGQQANHEQSQARTGH